MAELKQYFGLIILNLLLWQLHCVGPGVLVIFIIHCFLFPDLIQNLFILNFLDPLNSAQIIFNLEVVWHLQLQSMLSVKVIHVFKFFSNHSLWQMSKIFRSFLLFALFPILFDLIDEFSLF